MGQVKFDQFGNPFYQSSSGARVPITGPRAEQLKIQQQQQQQQQQPPPEGSTPEKIARWEIGQIKALFAEERRKLQAQKNQLSPEEYKELFRKLNQDEKDAIALIRENRGIGQKTANYNSPYNGVLTADSVEIALDKTPIPGETKKSPFNSGYRPQRRLLT